MIPVRRNILLNPGPATTSDAVKSALVVPDICPREREFGSLVRAMGQDLVEIVRGGSDYACVFFGGSGTAAMEASIASVVPPEGKLLVLVNGAYGRRMVEIAATHRIATRVHEVPSTEAIDPDAVDALLASDPDIATVAMVHHETTTGILNPLEAIGEVVHRHGRTLVVDAISSFAGIPIDIARCHVDFLLGTSNKCIQGMAGLAFVICRRAALDALAGWPPRSYYLDLHRQHRGFEDTGEMRFTPPVQVAYALRAAIDEFVAEGGVEARHARYTRNWEVLRAGLLRLGFRLLLEPEQESHILLTVHEPRHPAWDFGTLHDRLLARGFTIYPGKVGGLATFRLANMGDLHARDMEAFLAALEEVMQEMGLSLDG